MLKPSKSIASLKQPGLIRHASNPNISLLAAKGKQFTDSNRLTVADLYKKSTKHVAQPSQDKPPKQLNNSQLQQKKPILQRMMQNNMSVLSLMQPESQHLTQVQASLIMRHLNGKSKSIAVAQTTV